MRSPRQNHSIDVVHPWPLADDRLADEVSGKAPNFVQWCYMSSLTHHDKNFAFFTQCAQCYSTLGFACKQGQGQHACTQSVRAADEVSGKAPNFVQCILGLNGSPPPPSYGKQSLHLPRTCQHSGSSREVSMSLSVRRCNHTDSTACSPATRLNYTFRQTLRIMCRAARTENPQCASTPGTP